MPLPSPLRHAVSVAGLGLALLFTGAVSAPGAAGQTVPAIVGTAGGFVAGTYVTTAVYVTKARFGRFLFSLDDALTFTPELLPMVAAPVAGGWLGAESKVALGRAVGWGAVGFFGGAALGVGAGHLFWGDVEGRWAGAIIGSAAGMLTGLILGALDGLDDGGGEAAMMPVFSVRIPLGGP